LAVNSITTLLVAVSREAKNILTDGTQVIGKFFKGNTADPIKHAYQTMNLQTMIITAAIERYRYAYHGATGNIF